MRKTLLSLLAVIMLASAALSACGSGRSTGTSAPDAAASGGRERVSMSIAYWDMVDLNTDDWGKRILEQFNVDITAITLSWSNATEQLNVMAAGNDLPNFYCAYGLNFDWHDQGLLRSLPESLLSKYPIVNSMMQSQSYANALKDLLGEYYMLIRPFSVKGIFNVSQAAIYYRKDWMQEAGINKTPETTEELYQLLKAYKEKGFVNYPYTSAGFNTSLFSSYGAEISTWQQQDGVWMPGSMVNEVKDGLRFMRRLYKEELLDPEYMLNSYNEAIGKLAQGTVGAMNRNADTMWFFNTLSAFGEANPDKDPLDYITCMGPLKVDGKPEALWPPYIENGATFISAKTTDAQIDRMLDFVNYLMSEEGLMYRRYGQEGVDYKIENGNVVSTLAPIDGVSANNLLVSTYPSQVFGWFADWDGDNDADIGGNPNIPDAYKTEHMRYRKLFQALNPTANLTPTFIPTPAKNKLAIDYTAEFSQIIMSDGDIDAMFDTFLEYCYSIGAQEAIDELNAKTAEYGIK